MADVHSRPVLTNCDLNNYGIAQVHGGDAVVAQQLGVNPTTPQDVSQPQQPTAPNPMNNTFKPGRWSQEEHERFLRGFEMYGHKWRKVRDVVGTRTVTQVRTHAQKFFVKLKKQSTMEKPTITTPHKNSPRPMLPSLRKEILQSQKMGKNPNHDHRSQLQLNVAPIKAENYTFRTGSHSKFDSLLLAAEKELGGGFDSSSETPCRTY